MSELEQRTACDDLDDICATGDESDAHSRRTKSAGNGAAAKAHVVHASVTARLPLRASSPRPNVISAIKRTSAVPFRDRSFSRSESRTFRVQPTGRSERPRTSSFRTEHSRTAGMDGLRWFEFAAMLVRSTQPAEIDPDEHYNQPVYDISHAKYTRSSALRATAPRPSSASTK